MGTLVSVNQKTRITVLWFDTSRGTDSQFLLCLTEDRREHGPDAPDDDPERINRRLVCHRESQPLEGR